MGLERVLRRSVAEVWTVDILGSLLEHVMRPRFFYFLSRAGRFA